MLQVQETHGACGGQQGGSEAEGSGSGISSRLLPVWGTFTVFTTWSRTIFYGANYRSVAWSWRTAAILATINPTVWTAMRWCEVFNALTHSHRSCFWMFGMNFYPYSYAESVEDNKVIYKISMLIWLLWAWDLPGLSTWLNVKYLLSGKIRSKSLFRAQTNSH